MYAYKVSNLSDFYMTATPSLLPRLVSNAVLMQNVVIQTYSMYWRQSRNHSYADVQSDTLLLSELLWLSWGESVFLLRCEYATQRPLLLKKSLLAFSALYKCHKTRGTSWSHIQSSHLSISIEKYHKVKNVTVVHGPYSQWKLHNWTETSAVSAQLPPSQTPTGMNVNCQHLRSKKYCYV